MSTATAPLQPTRAREALPRPGRLSTLRALLRQRLRRDRWQLVIWLLSIGALAAFSAASIQQTYASAAARLQLMRLAIADPTILVLRGLPQGSTLAALTFFEIFTFLALLAGLMNTPFSRYGTRAPRRSPGAPSWSRRPPPRGCCPRWRPSAMRSWRTSCSRRSPGPWRPGWPRSAKPP